ncbi:glycerophosphodiester phosphodiesterase family protein [Novispirillum itersonii]|uniref:glycerophosphodiester phosphodiesterase family protein n=1 Tax=Novispirillum itersonii TaxID=189 RepID=UPI00037F4DD8|nr:glycerophosphodiester phosphodiesterase family protein [Novispirillum itersonii]
MSSKLYPFWVVGHRGAKAVAPENTLVSVRRAAADGAKMVEVDIKLTADGRAMVMHDELLDRTTDGSGPMEHTLFEAVSALDAGSWFAPEFKGEPVPTLEELIDVLAELSLAVNLEIKPCPGREAETAKVCIDIARAAWPAHLPPPVLSSFSRTSMEVARDLARDWPRAWLDEKLSDDWEELAVALDVQAAHLGTKDLTEADVRRVLASGHELAVWTVNDVARARQLRSWGAAAIITDNPALLIAGGDGLV